MLRHLAAVALCATFIHAQHLPGHVLDHRFITEGEGGFDGDLGVQDQFGSAIALIGDVNNDGFDDFAVGAPQDDDGGAASSGSVWILFMGVDAAVKGKAKISNTFGNLPVTLGVNARFGISLAPAGDLDGDGVPDLWVGASGFVSQAVGGAVFALRLESDGSVKSMTETASKATLPLSASARFGASVAVIGDADGNGVDDLVVGEPEAAGGGTRRGAIWRVLLAADGQFLSATRVSADESTVPLPLPNQGYFGSAVAGLGDIDGNGSLDFVVGAAEDSEVTVSAGALWLFLTDGPTGILNVIKMDSTHPIFAGNGPINNDRFGASLANIGDVDRDGDDDLAVGASTSGPGSTGAIYILRLTTEPSDLFEAVTRVDVNQGYLPFTLGNFDFFGASVAALGDKTGDGNVDIAVGITGDDTTASAAGAITFLSLRGPTFLDLGSELHTTLSPRLSGTGLLIANSLYSLSLENGPIFGTTNLVVGFDTINVPFHGGILVPDADILLVALPTEVDGSLHLFDIWPSGIPLGVKFFAQHWIREGEGVWAASNALGMISGD